MITNRMVPRWALPRRVRDGRWKEGGYVAVMTALLLMVLMGLTAFAVDVGHWYLVGQQEQRAADAAAMAGVSYLPGDSVGAFASAKTYSKINGFEHLPAATTNPTTVTTTLDGGRPTRLRVKVDRTVKNFFGSLLGVANTTVSRSAVADFAGPVPMGSPCNEYGNDPDATPNANRATTCDGVLGGFWANVNAKGATKQNGDAYQGNVCASTVDGCSSSNSGPNIDYATDGYYYTVSVKAAGMSSLKVELFDPVSAHQGLTCSSSESIWGDRDEPDEGDSHADEARNDVILDETTRYDRSSSTYCTGDDVLGGSQVMSTEFTVRSPGTSAWDVSTFLPVNGCTKVYGGYKGLLFDALDQYNGDGSTETKYRPDIADGFRRWTTLCTIPTPDVGDYLVQVKTNGFADTATGTNHFAIRATGGVVGDKENLAIAGREKMGIYANKPGVTTEFHLARVPSSAAGQTLKVRLFDVGDISSGGSGTIKIIRPPDADGLAFGLPANPCIGVRSALAPVTLTDCSLTNVQTSTHNGKWQSIAVPIPADYTCDDSDTTKCWVRLQYVYGSSTNPNDVTSWTAIIEGDPVRLVE